MRLIRIVLVLSIIFISGILVQIVRNTSLESLFKVNQLKVKVKYKNVTSEKIDTKNTNYQKAYIIYSKNDVEKTSVYYQISESMKLNHINVEFVEISTTDFSFLTNLKSNQVVIFATELLSNIRDVELIEKYVKDGGNVIFLIRGFSPKIDKLAGIRKNYGYMDIQKGIVFRTEIFPGLDKISRTKGVVHKMLNIELEKDCEILATTYTGTFPIIWERNIEKGKVTYVNSTMFQDKINRGLMMQLIARMPDYFISYILNAKMVHIDDFPAPIKIGKDDIIFKQYSVDNLYFYKNIWWNDIYNLSKIYNLKYSGFIIGQYNLSTSAPFPELIPEEIEHIKYFGRKLSETQGELGLHGYNHNSLALENEIDFADYGYLPWPNEASMVEGLLKVKKLIKGIFGEIHINTYVAPSNLMSPTGKAAVKKAFPEIKVFSGLYTSFLEKGILIQEFGPDKDVPGVYDIPRMSSGYINDENTMWSIYNGISLYGYVGHFIHPDDIFSPDRSSDKTWKDLSKDLESIFKEINSKFYMIKPLTLVESYEEYIRNEKCEILSFQENNKINIHVKNGVFPIYTYLKINSNLHSDSDELKMIYKSKTYSLYLMTLTKPETEIKLSR